LKGSLVVVALPVLLVTLLVQTLQQGGILFVFSITLVALYLYWAFDRVAYDSKLIRSVEIPGAPEEIGELLKKTTTSGDLIYVILLSSFQNNEKLSQTDMSKYAQRRGVTLTPQRIREYIKNLEDAQLISSPEAAKYEKGYRLTKKGMWCRNAVRQCFPPTTILFHVRNSLGLRRMGKFSDAVEAPQGTIESKQDTSQQVSSRDVDRKTCLLKTSCGPRRASRRNTLDRRIAIGDGQEKGAPCGMVVGWATWESATKSVQTGREDRLECGRDLQPSRTKASRQDHVDKTED
jgi:hypothetical protein